MATAIERPICVLCVDDEVAILDLTERVLERLSEPITVDTVESPAVALERFRDRHYDCIVTDYEMPEMDGVELLEAIREIDSGVPVILYTGAGSEDVASKAISSGVTDYLQKEPGTHQYELLATRIENAVSQHRALLALERSTARFEAVFDDPKSYIGLLTSEGALIDANDQLLSAIDADLEDIEGELFWEFPWPVEDDDALGQLREVIERAGEGEYVTFTIEIPDAYSLTERDADASERAGGDDWNPIADGAPPSTVLIDCVIRPVVDDGEITSIVIEGRDAGRYRSQETEIERRNAVMDEAPIGIAITDPNRPDNPIVSVNRTFEEMTGYSEPEILGQNCRFLQGERTDPDRVERMRTAIEAEERITIVLRNYRRDGTMFWNEVTVVPITDAEGICTNFVGFQRDVTQRKLIEERLRAQNERLEEYSSVVSHDLRGPLTIASGYLELARHHADDEVPYFDDVVDAHERLTTLIEDMRTLLRAGSDVDELVSVPVVPVLEDAWNPHPSVESTLERTVDEDVHVLADENRLIQLFENLFGNCLEHGATQADDEWTVTVTVGRLEDGLFVEDDGPGIPPDKREEVFEPGITTADDRSGYGLRIVRDIVEVHGWEISIDDATNGGARFEITGMELV